MKKENTLESFLRKHYNSKSYFVIQKDRPSSQFASECFEKLFKEESEREAIINLIEMRKKFNGNKNMISKIDCNMLNYVQIKYLKGLVEEVGYIPDFIENPTDEMIMANMPRCGTWVGSHNTMPTDKKIFEIKAQYGSDVKIYIIPTYENTIEVLKFLAIS